MMGVPRHLATARRRLHRVLAVVVLLAQVVTIAFAAQADARPSARGHIEEAGTQLHYSHNPSDCVACTALQLAGVPARPAAPPTPTLLSSGAIALARAAAPRGERRAPNPARAPPVLALAER